MRKCIMFVVAILMLVCTSQVFAAKEPYVYKDLTFNSPTTLIPEAPDDSNYWYWVKDKDDRSIMECKKTQDDKDDSHPKGYGICKLPDIEVGGTSAKKVEAEYFNKKLMRIIIYKEGYPKIYFKDHYNSNALIDDLELAFSQKFGSDLVKTPFKTDTRNDYNIVYKNKKYPKQKVKQIYVSKNDLIVRLVRVYLPNAQADLEFELIDKSLFGEYEKALVQHKQAMKLKEINETKQKREKATKSF